MTDRRNLAIKVAFGAGLLCLLVYLRTLSCGFINWDDPDYVINNPAIRSLNRQFFSDAFTTFYLGWWMPLTWISFAIDYHFWQLNPFGYHLTNILLHSVNTGLVVMIADALLNRWSNSRETAPGDLRYIITLLSAGLLFGIHPLRVESVAWVTERKDVLNGLFALGSIYCYLKYVLIRESSGKNGPATIYYVTSLLLFMFSLMAKSVSVVVPMLLLLADWYPFCRLRKGNLGPVLLEKLPFVTLSVLVSCLTVWLAAQDDSLLAGITFWQRVVISGNAIFEYCRLLLYPIGIIPLYVIPSDFFMAYTVKTVVVIALTVFVFAASRRNPCIAATWLGFVIPLLPTLAFTQNGMQAFAARFTYLPSLVISIVAANVIVGTCAERFPHRLKSLMFVPILALMISYAALTQRLVDVFKDSDTYWSRVIAFQPFDAAFYYRGLHYFDTGKYLAAINDFTTCLSAGIRDQRQDIFNLYAFRGQALIKLGRYDEAVRDLTAALEMSPQPIYFHYRGIALKALGMAPQATEDFERAGVLEGKRHGL